MFSLCPHCQFLLSRDPRSGRLPAACPKCGGAIVDDDPQPPAAPAAGSDKRPEGHEAAAVDAGPPVAQARRPRRRRTEEATEEATEDAAEDAAKAATKEPIPAQTAAASPPAASSLSGGTDAGAGPDADPHADANSYPNTDPGLDPSHDRALAPGLDPGLDLGEATPAADTPVRPAPDAPGQAQTDSPPEPGPDTATPPDPATAPAEPSEEAPAAIAGPETSPAPVATAKSAPHPPAAHGRRLPSFLQAREPGVRGPPREAAILWTVIGLLVLALALQLLLADRARLAMDAGWRPTLARMCGMLGCDLPPWREPQAFTMLSRDVRAHPQRPGTLRVTASFRNDARWPQPWPVLLLTLSDLDGRVAGARAFAPADYVEEDETDRLLEPGQTATVVLEVVEPAPRIVAFTFDFR
jgi:hypothetical protein